MKLLIRAYALDSRPRSGADLTIYDLFEGTDQSPAVGDQPRYLWPAHSLIFDSSGRQRWTIRSTPRDPDDVLDLHHFAEIVLAAPRRASAAGTTRIQPNDLRDKRRRLHDSARRQHTVP